MYTKWSKTISRQHRELSAAAFRHGNTQSCNDIDTCTGWCKKCNNNGTYRTLCISISSTYKKYSNIHGHMQPPCMSDIHNTDTGCTSKHSYQVGNRYIHNYSDTWQIKKSHYSTGMYRVTNINVQQARVNLLTYDVISPWKVLNNYERRNNNNNITQQST